MLRVFYLAESEGFEPPEPFSSTVFKTAAIDHSANSPVLGGANVRRILRKTNNLHLNLILILGCHDFCGTDRGENGCLFSVKFAYKSIEFFFELISVEHLQLVGVEAEQFQLLVFVNGLVIYANH